MLKFGYTAQVGPPADRLLRALPRIEAQGWDFIRFPDQMAPTHPHGWLPKDIASPDDPEALPCTYGSRWFGSFELVSAASVLTSRMGIEGNVVDPLRRSPAVFAQEAATITHLSKGRAMWAIGSGENKQFEPYGEKRIKPIERMAEAVRTMHALWDSPEKAVSRESEYWPLQDAVFPLPLYEGRKPPLMMVGGGPVVEQLAGELCDGWATFLPGGANNNPEDLKRTITSIRQIAEDHGRDPDALHFHGQVMLLLAESDDAAWALSRHPGIAWMAAWGAGVMSGKVWKELGYVHPFGEDASWPKNMKMSGHSDDLRNTLPGLIPEEITDRTYFLGGADRVARRLEPFIEAGLTEIVFNNLSAQADQSYGPSFAKMITPVITNLGGKPLKLDV